MRIAAAELDAFTWLRKIGTPGLESATWYLEVSEYTDVETTWTHTLSECWSLKRADRGNVSTYIGNWAEPHTHPTCVRCKYGMLGEDATQVAHLVNEPLRTQIATLHQAYLWLTDVTDGTYADAITKTPNLHGLLIDFVATRALNNLQKYSGHGVLKKATATVAALARDITDAYPFSAELAVKEAMLLGAKELTTQKVCGWGIEVSPGLFTEWLQEITELTEVPVASDRFQRGTAYLETMIYAAEQKSSTIYLDPIPYWENTFKNVVAQHMAPVTYGVTGLDHLQAEAPTTAHVALQMVGLKAVNSKRGFGILPELAVEWLARTQNFRHGTVSATGAHQPLSDEQWQTALILWTEATRNSSYEFAVNALNAAAAL